MARARSVIEFGTSKIICLTDKGEKVSRDAVSAKACVRYEGIVEGRFVNKRGLLSAVEKAVEQCEELSGKQITSAVVCVPACLCHHVMGKTVKNFNNARLEREHVTMMLEEGRPAGSEGYSLIDERPIYFDDCAGMETIDAPIGSKVRRLYMFSAYTFIRNSHLDLIVDTLKQLNITIERMVLAENAVALHYIPEHVRDDTAILIDAGYTSTSISTVLGNALSCVKTVDLGGYDIAFALERKLEVSTLLAENIKRNHIFDIEPSREGKIYAKDELGKMHSLNQYKVNGIMETQTDKLLLQIHEVLKELTRLNFCERNTPVFICGGGLAIKGITRYASERLGRKVYLVGEKDRVKISPIYHSAISLLDNRLNWVYDSNSGIFEKTKKTNKLLAKFR